VTRNGLDGRRWVQRLFWSLQSRTWDDVLQRPADRRLVTDVVRWLDGAGRNGEERVLDLGCGTGTYSVALAERGFNVVGLDFAPGMLRRARAKARAAGWTGNDRPKGRSGGMALERADFNRPLPFADATFDAALSVYTLHCAADPGVFLAEVRRVLKPSGRLVLVALAGRGRPEGHPLRTSLPHRAFWWFKRRLVARDRWPRYAPDALAALLEASRFAAAETPEIGGPAAFVAVALDGRSAQGE
jgi:SAM-dependent methyltransferase